MSIAFGLPLALAALAALLIPLLLHLDRRRSLQTIQFAALRWLGSGHPPQRTLRVIEWLLLILRLLLIALIALWLAKPLLLGEWRAAQRWVAVVPGVSAAAIDANTTSGDRLVWLTPGFPAIDLQEINQPASQNRHDTASLLRQLDSELQSADRLRVLVPSIVRGLDAQAIILSREVEWQIDARAVAAGAPETDAPQTPHSLAIRFDAASAAALPWLRAAVSAWATSPALAVNVSIEPDDVPITEDIDAIIWLGSAPPEAAMRWVEAGASLLHAPSTAAAEDPPAEAMSIDSSHWPGSLRRVGRGQLIALAAPLNPLHVPQLHDASFALELHQRLFGKAPSPDRAFAAQVEPSVVARDMPAARTDLRQWLAWLIAGLFALERLLASGHRLRRAA